jgi:type VI secretion system secreted protein Hcp
MAFDAFVKIDGIEGESSDSNYSGWMEALDYGMSVAQKASRTTSSAGGFSVGRADFSEFTFRKELDLSSPAIALACADGAHIDSVTIVVCRSGKDKVKFMEYQLSDCMISEVLTIGGGEFPSETISITFAKIVWTYSRQKRQGGFLTGNLATGWNLQKNCRV